MRGGIGTECALGGMAGAVIGSVAPLAVPAFRRPARSVVGKVGRFGTMIATGTAVGVGAVTLPPNCRKP